MRPNVDRWCELELDDQSALVMVRVRDWAREPEIAEVLTRAGARSRIPPSRGVMTRFGSICIFAISGSHWPKRCSCQLRHETIRFRVHCVANSDFTQSAWVSRIRCSTISHCGRRTARTSAGPRSSHDCQTEVPRGGGGLAQDKLLQNVTGVARPIVPRSYPATARQPGWGRLVSSG